MPTGILCGNCPQQLVGKRFVEADGSGSSGVMIVGDSPWNDEIVAGKPFAGASGKLLERIFHSLGRERGDFVITNTMRCRPPHLDWTDYPARFPAAQAALQQCAPYLANDINQFKPRCVVALGNVAFRGLTGLELGVLGSKPRIGYVSESPWGIPVIGEPHPSFMLKGNQKYVPVLTFGLQRALDIAAGEFQPTEINLCEDPSVEKLRNYLAGPLDELMIDIETDESGKVDEEEAENCTGEIVRCGVSLKAAEGVSFPWRESWISEFAAAVKRAKAVITWNGGFDLPRLRAAGCTFPADCLDAMWAWHFLQSDLRKGLAFVAPFFYAGPAWKHLSGAKPAFYNAMDAAVQMLIWKQVKEKLQKQEVQWSI